MEITTVGIVGCGQMGAGIAEVAAKAGFEVMICEVDDGILTSGLAKIDKSLAKAVEKGKLAEADMTDVLSRISGTVSTEDLADCDIVIEAVFEDLDVKRAVFAELDRVVKPEAILASNTSSISIAAIATATQRGDKVIGMHFFNPVPVMALVEYVPSILTSQETIDAVSALGEKLGKTGVLAKDTPGFIVNRLLVAYLLDAIRVYEQGLASREDIDNAMKLGAAHPMGPLTLSDFIGLDVIKQVAQVFFEEYGEPRYSSPPLLTRMVSAGLLGRKSGRGFYDYSKR
ncbi:MAG: 3-hydroxybutyryl-CoA dehydrogenase [Anaerolineae bacterium]|nr:3-hydroxybutyryl-CoA dehydrogenase [Anaerolineae bacterium]MCB9130467.1 3-hydroxybutyryl-CoA dehydrogenase [Anaerolineales bacterium]MCB0229408.1 3-hydroxybutyryl-CoA dehydrogenase [Anaerolineae bacterium]MCB0238003.1 3-hydroxybutyryl-CoA dehydrogenase [Anaerolineae bacterium]MCB0244173.1 3-hydroxybutyryl-CoA dehydrogenase [Anaerolineae bacterium]